MAVSIKQLLTRAESSNLVSELDKDLVSKISLRCIADYEADETSREPWMTKSKDALNLAMQVTDTKTFPWPDAANVKYPLLTVAALQFHARAYPSIIRGDQVVKGQVTGFDPTGEKAEKALRIGKFMSWQCLEDMDGWEEDMDKLLMCIPILGCMFKKTYFDPNTKKNRSDLVFPQNLVINYKTKNFSSATRVTQLFTLAPQEIIERQMQGVYVDGDLLFGSDRETEEPQEMLEQHCLIDIDEDDYKEPYIATIHKTTGKLLRLVANYGRDTIFVKVDDSLKSVEEAAKMGLFADLKLARISPVAYFTKYPFIPSPDGGIYDLGFGQILLPIIETINTSINQMLDAGTRQNAGGGFIAKGLQVDKRGNVGFIPGEYKQVDNMTGGSIRDAIVPLDHSGPSGVTFNLLNRLIQVCQDMTTVQDIMVGGAQDQETATTTLSRVDQGMKLFTAIYKRVYRSMKDEFKKLYRLNKYYLPVEQYFKVMDSEIIQKIGLRDFQGDDTDVQPIADPTISSLPLKLAKAQVLKQVSAGNPMYNQREVERRFLDAMEEPNIETILLNEDQMKSPPDPKLLEVQGKLEKIMAEIEDMKIQRIKTASEVMLNLAKTEAAEAGNQMDSYRLGLESLKHELEVMKIGVPTEQGGTAPVEGQPTNPISAEIPGGIPPEFAAAVGDGGVPQAGQPGADGVDNSAMGGMV